jgi:hypothetical protein
MCVCVCKYFHYVNVCKYFSLCVGCKYFQCVKIFVKKIKICTMRLNVPCMFDRRHGLVFELTCVCSSAAPYLTHTLLHACV